MRVIAGFEARITHSVAVAGKIAGNARNSPPTPWPQRLAMIPASAVTNPPKAKRTRHSYHFDRPRAAKLTSIFMNQFKSPYSPNATTSQRSNAAPVAGNAAHFRRIINRLTADA